LISHYHLTLGNFCCRDAEERNLVISHANASDLFPELDCWQNEQQEKNPTKPQTKPMKNESTKAAVGFGTVPMQSSRAPRPMVSTKPMVSVKSKSLSESRRKQDSKKMRREDGSQSIPTRGKVAKRKGGTIKKQHSEPSAKKYPKIPDTR
jgi:hypothetical protein